MKDKILAILNQYRTDFSTPDTHINSTDNYGIKEEAFYTLADDLITLFEDTKEAEEKQARLNEYNAED